MTASSELNTVDALSERLAKRAALKSRSPKCAEYLDELAESDVLTQHGLTKMADGEGMLGSVKNWWQGMDPNARQAIQNTGIGAGIGGVGGGLLNYLATDEDDERRHPFSSALTGALAGAGAGGLGTLAYQNFDKLRGRAAGENPNTDGSRMLEDRLADEEAIGRDAYDHLVGTDTAAETGFSGRGQGGMGDGVSWRDEFAAANHGADPQTAANMAAGAYYLLRNAPRIRPLTPGFRNAQELARYRSGLSNIEGMPAARRPSGVTDSQIGMLRTGDNLQALQQAARRNTSFRPTSAGGTPSTSTYTPTTVRNFSQALRSAGDAPPPLPRIPRTRGMAGALGILAAPEAIDVGGNAYLSWQQQNNARQLREHGERLSERFQ